MPLNVINKVAEHADKEDKTESYGLTDAEWLAYVALSGACLLTGFAVLGH
jgi:hypothetical protein